MTYLLQHDSNGAPVLVTGRLVLRKPNERDWDAMATFWASDRSLMMGGPWDAETLRRELDDLYVQWNRHGFSLFTVTRKGSDQGLGGIGPFFPERYTEVELGWSLWNVADEGQGLAFEAAEAARDWFFGTFGHATAVSYTDPENHRSHRLCERLGGVVDPKAVHPFGDEPDQTYRYFAGGRA